MSKLWAKINNFLLFSLLLPVVYGCNSGGGGGEAAPLGGLFMDEPATTATGTLLADGGGETLAQIHNPEPATLMLIGGGMMAMGYMRSRAKKL